jgi:hypothetical protein
MSIELTETELTAWDAEEVSVSVVDPRTNAGYVLVPISEFETAREISEDDRRQRAIRRTALRNAARAGEQP